MKKFSKGLAFALASSLVISMMPVSASAAAPSSITLKGKATTITAATSDVVMTGAAGDNTIKTAAVKADLLANSTDISVAYEVLQDATIDIYGTVTATAGQAFMLTAAQETALWGTARADFAAILAVLETASSATELTAGASKAAAPVGSIIYLYDDDGTNEYLKRFVLVQGSGSVEGGSTVKKPTLNVVLPLVYDFSIDTLQLASVVEGNQLSGADFQILNKSDVPVLVTYSLETTLAGGASLSSGPLTAADHGTDKTASTDKKAYFGVLSAFYVTTEPAFATNSGGVFRYRANETGAFKPFTTAATAGNVKLSFMLDKASATAFAPNYGSVAAFQMYGDLATYAPWAADDLKIGGTYTISGVTADTYTNKLGTTNFGLNGYDATKTIEANARVQKDHMTRLVMSRQQITDNDGVVTVQIDTDGNNGKEAGTVTSVKNTLKDYTFTSADYTYDATSGIYTQKLIPTANNEWQVIEIVFGTGATASTYTVGMMFLP